MIAVHPYRDYYSLEDHRAALEMELPRFSQEVIAAQESRVAANEGRVLPEPGHPMLITDVHHLRLFFTEVGAYDHPDGPPAQPPPACGAAVSGRSAANRALVRDCQTLLATKDALRGTAALNWSAELAIGSWTGVTVGGTPQRATTLSLASSSLNGTIPPELGSLSGLATLDLSNNMLTGSIPATLGELSDLTTLKLSGNALSGCIPPALRDVATSDLTTIGLSYCDMLTPPPAPSGASLSLADSVFTVSWNAVNGVERYEAQHLTDAGEWTTLPETEETTATYSPEDGLTCGTSYGIRVRAYGDGVMHSAQWGDLSGEVAHNTDACNQAPDFDPDSYSFTLDESALTGTLVGTVSAADLDEGDVVAYSITAGNEDCRFTLDESSGEITRRKAGLPDSHLLQPDGVGRGWQRWRGHR